MNSDEIITSDMEDQLLNDDAKSARTHPAVNAKRKQSNKSSRQKMVDENRAKSQSLDDISRLTQTTLPFVFGKQITGASTNSTLISTPNENAAVSGEPTMPPGAKTNPDTASDATKASNTTAETLKLDKNAQNSVPQNQSIRLQTDQKAFDGATPPSTSNVMSRPTTLKDIDEILSNNIMRSDAEMNSTQVINLRPPLNSTSTTNKNSGAVKKPRRCGGKKYKEMMAKRAEREQNRHNIFVINTTAEKNLQSQIGNKNNPTGTVRKDAKLNANTNKGRQNLHVQNTGKRGRIAGDTPPDAIQKNKKATQTHNTNTPTSSKASTTLADVIIEANLVIAVFDSPAPGGILPMDKVKYNQLYESINNTLFSDIEKCSVIPTFGENKHVRGVMKVTCSTPGAKCGFLMR